MASKLQIVNAALELLAQTPVPSLTSASLAQSGAATQVLRILDQARDVVLRRHGWLCALEYASLTPAILPAACSWKFPHVYLLPTAALRVWEIGHCRFREGYGWGTWLGGRWEGMGQRWETGTIDTDIGARQIVRSRDGVRLDLSYVRTPSWEAIDVHVGDAIAAMAAWRSWRSVKGGDPGADLKAEVDERVQIAISVDGTQADSQSRGPSELHTLRQWCG